MANIMKCVFYISSIIVLTEILYNIRQYFNRRSKRESNVKSKKVNKSIRSKETGLFFPDYSQCCPFVFRKDYYLKSVSFEAPEVMCLRPFCKFVHFSTDPKTESPLRRLVQILNSSKKSLDVCLWVFSLEILANVCINLHKNNVCVRIVVDSREDETTKSQISRLVKEGIEVRFGPRMTNYGMFHHKFAVVDKKTLMTGSFNWTRSAIWKSFENVLITSDQVLVSSYVEKFNQYWNEFSSKPTNIRL
jgi:cardiolipin hydrolase